MYQTKNQTIGECRTHPHSNGALFMLRVLYYTHFETAVEEVGDAHDSLAQVAKHIHIQLGGPGPRSQSDALLPPRSLYQRRSRGAAYRDFVTPLSWVVATEAEKRGRVVASPFAESR